MSKTKFTPGPWRAKYGLRHSPDECDITIGGDIFFLADMNGPNYAHCEANAHLIAAAPELYEKLAIVTDQLEKCAADLRGEYDDKDSDWLDNLVIEAKAVLAKARGES